jgi:DNA-binding LacI/PurR family transcriptional regulator
MKRSAAVTLKMLAQRVGLTKGTVSAVLNCTPHSRTIPQCTKDRVFAAARELNYQPNPIARALRTGLVAPVNHQPANHELVNHAPVNHETDDVGNAAGALMFKDAEHLMRAIRAIRQAGLNVPDDVSILGAEEFAEFDDLRAAPGDSSAAGPSRDA